MTLTPGVRLGRYEILDPIGAGGMGEVWRAHDTELGRDVAIKVLPAGLANSPERRTRFEREASATASLNHPNLLTIHDVGIEDGLPFLVTELLEGESLRQNLRRGLPSPSAAVAWGLAIAEGLAAAHANAVVHRDIKPDNVFLTNDNRVKILDFGLAKIIEKETSDEDETATLSGRTAAGAVLGTVGYMAPEQLRGEPVDIRTDVFALGCVLYELLSGRRPFAGNSSAEHISAVLRDEPFPLDEAIPHALRAIVHRCLEKKPAARYQSAGEVSAALDAINPSMLKSTPGRSPFVPIQTTQSSAEPTVAVMPFTNLSGDPEQEYFCDGMAEEILGAIGKVRGLRVLARSSSFAFKDQQADPRLVGTTIGADHLLEGSVRRAGEQIRVSARLVQARDGIQIWADRFDRTISDIFELQDEISFEVANQLRTALMPEELGELSRRYVPDREAYDLFLRGRFLWYRRREGDLMEALKLYSRAIEIDPRFLEPRIGLADAFSILGAWLYMDPTTAYGRVLELVEETLVIEADLASAHAARGFVNAYHLFDWQAGERDFCRAIELDPTAAPVRCWYAGLLNDLGRHGEGAEQARRAIDLEPLSPMILGLAGWNIAFEDVDAGLCHQRRAVDIDPEHPIANLFLATTLVERIAAYEEAIPYIERSLAGGSKLSLALLVLALSKTGQTDRLAEVEVQISALQPKELMPNWIAALRAVAQSDQDAFIRAIDQAVDTGEFPTGNVAVWSFADFVRDDLRFQEILRRIGLENVRSCPTSEIRSVPPSKPEPRLPTG